MAKELVYTSARRGLRPGTSGFCTVACTQGMSPSTVQVLESLSAYRTLYDGHDPRAERNPPSYSHYRYTLDGRSVSIVSRVAFCGVDHTGRANKIAHHLVIEPRERPADGPAWLALQEGVLLRSWEGQPHYLPAPRELPTVPAPAGPAQAWSQLAGDPGWAGALAYAFESRPTIPAFVVFEPGMDMLPLIAEAARLLAPDRRWLVTFNTNFAFLPAGTTCAWRCCVPDSDALREGRRLPRALVIDLTRPLPAPTDNPLVRLARQPAPPEPTPVLEPTPAQSVLPALAPVATLPLPTALSQPSPSAPSARTPAPKPTSSSTPAPGPLPVWQRATRPPTLAPIPTPPLPPATARPTPAMPAPKRSLASFPVPRSVRPQTMAPISTPPTTPAGSPPALPTPAPAPSPAPVAAPASPATTSAPPAAAAPPAPAKLHVGTRSSLAMKSKTGRPEAP